VSVPSVPLPCQVEETEFCNLKREIVSLHLLYFASFLIMDSFSSEESCGNEMYCKVLQSNYLYSCIIYGDEH
jgi:hypothetical protein